MREAVTGSKGASEKVHCSLLLLQIALIPTISLSGRYLNKGVEQTPVIFMSATPPPNIQARTDLVFLEKPFEMDALLILIRQLLANE
jgi:hypothetical protein